MEPARAAAPTATEADALASLSGLPFAKGHGTGNDFVLVADPDGTLTIDPGQVAALCDRHLGLGGDGLIRAVRSGALPEGRPVLAADPRAEWFMDYRNGDGSVAEMCGNGVRVFVHFLVDQGLATLGEGESLTIGTRAGLKTVHRTADGYAVDMGPWAFADPGRAEATALDSVVETEGLDVARPALSVDMGNPHTVVALSNTAELADLRLHAAPIVDPVPEHGTNVEYVVPAEPLVTDGVGSIAMRVHERGVGETQSCGTGACAAVVATRHWAQGAAAGRWDVRVPGGTVSVRFVPGADGTEHVELSGPARIVARGTLA